MHDTWLIILNPHAGVGKGARDRALIEELLDKNNIQYTLVVSEYPGHTISLTKDRISNGYHKIIVAGGDGTLNEVVNGVYSQDIIAPDKLTLGMIPVGTGNDWIRTFGIPLDYNKAIETILEGRMVKQDVGRIIKQVSEYVEIRHFANMTGYGFDAMVAHKANQMKDQGRSGLLVYLYSLLYSYVKYKAIRMRIKIDGNEVSDQIFSCSLGIGKFNGGGMMQAPDAIPNNGSFQLTVIRKIGIWTLIKNLKGLFDGTFVHDKHVSTYTVTKVELESKIAIPGEADGENLGVGNYRIDMLPHALNVIYGDGAFLDTERTETQLAKNEEIIHK